MLQSIISVFSLSCSGGNTLLRFVSSAFTKEQPAMLLIVIFLRPQFYLSKSRYIGVKGEALVQLYMYVSVCTWKRACLYKKYNLVLAFILFAYGLLEHVFLELKIVLQQIGI